MPDHKNREGQRLDNYHLLRLLGRGSFGEVYLARHVYRGNTVAIKVLSPLADSDMADFLNEARTIRLRHAHIVQIQDFGVDGHTPFIVMDYAPHGTLRQRHPKGSRVPPDVILSYVKQAADALQYAHEERIIHRDIKPENLLCGPHHEILVSDFGIATTAHSSLSQITQTAAGTMAYMAPEQIKGKPRFASDQYALAVIVYEWFCGERPFNGTSIEVASQHLLTSPPPLHEKVADIGSDIERTIMKALAKDPKDRFESIKAFAEALEQTYQLAVEPIHQQQQAHLIVSEPDIVFPKPPPRYQEKEPPVVEQMIPTQSVLPPPYASPPPPRETVRFSPLSSSTYSPPGSTSSEMSLAAVATAPLFKNRVRNRVLAFSLLLALVLIAASSLVGYFFYGQTQNASYIDQMLNDAKTNIQRANAEVQNNPSDALQKLVDVQKKLHTVQTSRLNATETSTLNKLLQNDFTSAVRNAITNYDTQTQISSIPCPSASNVAVASVSNGNVNTQPGSVVSVKIGNTTSSYALGDDLNLYQMTNDNQGRTLGTKILLSGTGTLAASSTSIATDGTRFVVLTATNTTYTLQTFVPNAQGVVTKATSVATIDPTLLNNGLAPKFVTAWNQDIYVVLTPTTGSASSVVLDFTLDHDNFLGANGTPRTVQISSSTPIRSITALQNNQLFLLLDDGNIQSLQLGGNSAASVSIQMQQPIPAPLSTSAAGFTPNTLVPTPSAALSSDFLAVPSANALASGDVVNGSNTTQHLYVIDPTYHRTLDLIISNAASAEVQTPGATAGAGTPTATAKANTTPAATSNGAKPTLQARLAQQFVSASLLATVKSIAADPAGNGIDLLTQNGSNNSNLNFITVDVRQQSPC